MQIFKKIELAINKKLESIVNTPTSLSLFLMKLPWVFLLVCVLCSMHPIQTLKAFFTDLSDLPLSKG